MMRTRKHAAARRLFAAVMLFVSAALAAQNLPDADGILPPEEDGGLPQEDFGGTPERETVNPELQRNFTIVCSPLDYNLNPHTATYSAEAQILTGLYEGLFSYNPVTLEPDCAIAESFRTSRDKRRWTFILRADAAFSDGARITARDFAESWLDLLSDPAAPYSSLLDIVRGAREYRTGRGAREDVAITAADDSTLKVQLTSPTPHLPKILCMTAFAAVNKNPAVSSGPFYLAERTGDTFTLRKNPNYHDRQNTRLEQITIVQRADGAESAHLFNTGEADWISGAGDVSKILLKDSVHIAAEFATEYLFFKINGRADSVWSRADFRAALLEAVPWDELRAGLFVPAATLVYPLHGYPSVQGYSYTDPDEAASLMKKAREDASVPADEKLSLVFAVSGSEFMTKEAEILRKAWEPLGVDLETVEIPVGQYLAGIPDTAADLFSYTWIGDFADPVAFLELFRGGSTLNVTGWSDGEYDRLLGEAAFLTDEKRLDTLAQAEQRLLDSALILPIQHPVSLNIIDLNSCGGWASNSFDIHPMKFLYRKKAPPLIPNIVMGRAD